jgi:hypothetical protein
MTSNTRTILENYDIKKKYKTVTKKEKRSMSQEKYEQ